MDTENPIRFLLIGSGCRESALALKIKKSQYKTELFCISGYSQPQISELSLETFITNMNDEKELEKLCLRICKEKQIDFVLIGSEKYLMTQMVVEIEKTGVFCIAPNHLYSRIETSKNYARLLLGCKETSKYNPDYITITAGCSLSYIMTFLDKHGDKVVVKPDMPMGGKGVKVYGEHLHSRGEILEYITEILSMENTSSEPIVVLEEKLEGKEFSFISVTDGITTRHSFPIADFKRLREGDRGPNTGSMGCITEGSLLSFLTEDDIKLAKLINENILLILNKENRAKLYNDRRYLDIFKIKYNDYYKGFLYGSFIKLKDGSLKVIEFNARLGDPEAIPFLQQLSVDFVDLCIHLKNRSLNTVENLFTPQPSLTQYIVPKDYPYCKENTPMDLSYIYPNEMEYTFLGSIASSENEYITALTSRTLCIYSPSEDLTTTYYKVDPIVKRILKNHNNQFYSRMDLLNTYLGYDVKSKKQKRSSGDLYKDAGVDIDLGNSIVRSIGPIAKETYNDLVLNEIGSFGGCFSLPTGYKDPIIVSSIDGVGTKSIVVENVMGMKGYYNLGQDIVNHCVNDILVQGAKPLFFMDYIASSKLTEECVVEFVRGISYACKNVGCVLLGGETAEMPNVYNEDRYDLVGNIVGIVDKKKMICPEETICEGDIIYALPSSGPHTNGYSLIRKILGDYQYNGIYDKVITYDFLQDLCAPHRSYLNEIVSVMDADIPIHGLCHVTGGGFHENIVRILPNELKENFDNFPFSPLFQKIQSLGSVNRETMMRVFNCGWGMLLITGKEHNERLRELLPELIVIGDIVRK